MAVAWITLFRGCNNLTEGGYHQWAWPDGVSMLEQSNITVRVFGIIREEMAIVLKARRDAQSGTG